MCDNKDILNLKFEFEEAGAQVVKFQINCKLLDI